MSWTQAKTGLGIRKALRGVSNGVSRAVAVGNYWRWVAPTELADGIAIASLVAPLRYDVLVRRDFFALYERHRALYRSDAGVFLELVRGSTYYTWFMRSEAVRCKRELLGDAHALDAALVERVHRAARLYEVVATSGFSVAYPITLKTAEQLLPPTTDRQGPPTGKMVTGRYFLADGCHRLALLMALGYETLPAAYFRVKCFRRFSPFDSTSLLVRQLAVPSDEYFAFLSGHYCAPHRFCSRQDVVSYVQHHRPALLAELQSVMEVDGYADAA